MTAFVVAAHYLRETYRHKFVIFFGVVQPALYLVFFGPVFTGAGIGDWDVLVPGLLMQLALLTCGLTGFNIVFDHRFGVLERLRVTPASRFALLVGRVMKDAVLLLVQAVILLVLAAAFGLRASLPGMVAGLVLVVAMALGLAALSYAAALTLGDELFAPVVGTAVVPLLLLSGALLPMGGAPTWLDVASQATPFRHVVDALRALFAGSVEGLGWAVVGVGLFLAVALPLATRVFNRENA
ncbi:ABC transporter permease [Herbidospora mongoliensis]|uniref:ABC transporter permease n=1 Tax=Herbidospora mongoliensis TaxID=688067 RepID=UPI00082BA9C6|nr:ABC transporter permease [Herbidospora mongoliensis]